eukprot:4597097-Prorocentrum_lima.AAC.1
MTSSLVGSEMCIRDRLSLGPAGGGPNSPTNCCLSSRRSPWNSRRRKNPVSYTHLTLPTICSV